MSTNAPVQHHRLTTPIIGKVIAVSYESGAKGQFIIELQAKNNTYEGYYSATQRRGWLRQK